jgi:hypothetical protein
MQQDEKINKKWYEVEQLEQQSFPTSRSYDVIIEREAIPIVFVPGIMGSRLYAPSKNKMVWDPDDQSVMKSNFLTWGGLGQKSPRERLDVLVGTHFNSNYLQVAGTDNGTRLTNNGKYTDALRKKIVQDSSSYWDWARRDQRVSETARFDNLQMSGGNKGKYTRSQTPRLPWEQEANPVTNESLGTLAGRNWESELAVFNGWAGVTWDFYGQVLLHLSNQRWEHFNKCFYFPVYAFGYNWSDSNEVSGQQLATYINNVITHEKTREGKANLCNYCIVVTHSMGGIVARWASEKSGAKHQILGIVHGAQPVTGTPSAYHQFRAGEDVKSIFDSVSEWGASRVIGSDAEHLDPIFGHCPGPVQLLPNQKYVTNASNQKHTSSAKWLFQTNRQGQSIAQLPDGNPYDSIYAHPSAFLGFSAQAVNVLDEGPNGAMQGGSVKGKAQGPGRSGPIVMLANLNVAKQFHAQLELLCHPNTFYGYGIKLADKTYDQIIYSWKRDYMQPQAVYSPYGGGTVVTDPGDSSLGQGVDFDKKEKAYFAIAVKDASGDGTVAASSSTALGKPGGRSHDKVANYPEIAGAANDSVIRAFPVTNVEHSAYYNRQEALNFTVEAICELAQNYLCKKLGKKQQLAQLPLPPF